jgi:hypothetical protein
MTSAAKFLRSLSPALVRIQGMMQCCPWIFWVDVSSKSVKKKLLKSNSVTHIAHWTVILAKGISLLKSLGRCVSQDCKKK